MSDWLAGLAGGAQGAGNFVQQLMALKERDEERRRAQANADRQFQSGQEQFQYSKDRDVRGDQQWDQQFQSGEAARRLAAEQWQKEQDQQTLQHGIETVRLVGKDNGVVYEDPERAYQMRKMGAIPQGTGGAMGGNAGDFDILGMLKSMGSGAGQTTQAVNQARETGRKQNVAGVRIDSPSGAIDVENKQFRQPDPNAGLNQQYRQDQLRSRLADQVTTFNNSLKMQQGEIREQVIKSMPQIEQKYGRALRGELGPTLQGEASRELETGQFARAIQQEIEKQMESRRQGFIRAMQYAHPDASEQDIHYMLYGKEMPGAPHMSAQPGNAAMDEILRKLGISQ